MNQQPNPEAFTISQDDPFAQEHAAVSAWIEDAFASLGKHNFGKDVALKSLPSGKKLVDGTPDQSRRFVLAAVAQSRHWHHLAEQIRANAPNEMQRINAHHLPGWGQVWGRCHKADAVVSTLMRRALPFEKRDLVNIVQWSGDRVLLSTYLGWIGHLTQALERYRSETPIDSELRNAMKQFAARLGSSSDAKFKRFGTTVQQLCVDTAAELATDSAPPEEVRPTPTPAPAGSVGVLDQLKRLRKMVPDDPASLTTLLEPDRFALREDSPLRHEHELISAVFEEVVGTPQHYKPDLERLSAGRALLALKPAEMGKAILAAAERHVNALLASPANVSETRVWQSRTAAASIANPLLHFEFEVQRDAFFDLVLYLSARPSNQRALPESTTERLILQAETEAANAPLTEGERYVLWLFRTSLISGPLLGAPSDAVARLSRLINDGAGFYLVPGEAWSDAVNGDLPRLKPAQRAHWAALLTHAMTATAARPSAKWLAAAGKLVNAIGGDDVRQTLERWLPLVAKGQTIGKLVSYVGDTRGAADVMNEENATCLRGLLWLVQTLPRQQELARLIASVALSAYKKVPGVGPRAVKVGNASIYALSEMTSTDAVGQLAMLKVRVRFGTASKEIDKAFNTAAEALGLPREQIEELGVPSYGLEEIGVRHESYGDYRADLIVTGSDAELKWFDANGKPLKAVPAKVKSDHADDWKELQQSLKDIQAMLPAQRDRIDSMFLAQQSWPIEDWRERYQNHPLVGTIARRLLWCVDGTPALFIDGQPTDVSGEPIACGTTAKITLWHPVERTIDEITSWRQRLEERGITQPFKQAHREVYLLTDAERNTGTYSNRFAAHIIRQHQFNALCAARGWKNKLRLMVDDDYPPAFKELPQWGLRAEFWVEGVGDDHGTDTNESGVFLRLATDQVRFYRMDAAPNAAHASGGSYTSNATGPGVGDINEPLPVEQVPALVFSEIMRDVDLFVGVASVGNDPTWQDGGPEGRYRAYWQDYSFGELSGTATTRKQVLERLVPRLKIADRCSFVDRFLVVRGKKRTYKIHLGSGNILMEPNDQYLCIVPDSRSRASQDNLFLPFEGDNTLSIIISKALLLAEDTKIKDLSIVRQIDGL